jgi:hypothetical protein
MSTLPPPPVPEKLCEMLKDYPEHLQELQKALSGVVEKASKVTPPFEMAVWMLEDTLADFVVEAAEELKVAESSGDSAAIANAKEKYSLMGRARSKARWIADDRLWEYFQANKGTS